VVPVSSSAQLTLLPWLLGWDEAPHRTTFAAALHAGSCAGLLWALREDLRRLSARDVLVLGATSAPAAVAGLLGADAVEARLGTRRQLAVLLPGAGALLWAADRRPEGRLLDGRAAAAAAVAQVAALVPGVSRTGATLTALRLRRVDRAAAQRFSLLMSLPVTAGAAGLTLLRAESRDLRDVRGPLAVGVPVAALVAGVSAAGQRRRGVVPVAASALYRLGLAVAVVVRLQREKR
jgi:undecaprenyl-diphosphatase